MAVTDVRFRRHLRAGGEIALLCYLDHPDGEVRYWSRSGTLHWDGHAWQGLGALGRVTGISRSAALDLAQVTLELRGVPPTSTEILSSNVTNRSARLWLAGIARQRVVGEPYVILDDLMDFQSLKVGDDGLATIRIRVNVGFWTIERATNLAWTHERQIVKFPDDTGLSLITTFSDKQSNWRRDP